MDDFDANQDKVSLGFRRVAASEKKKVVTRYFDRIARRYDLADDLLSLGLHHVWKRRSVALLGLPAGGVVLDVCGGTGDLAIGAARNVGSGGQVVVYDLSRNMIEVGREKVTNLAQSLPVRFVQGDAERLSFCDSTFDGAIVSFGIRNVAHPTLALREMFRVLKHGGRFVCLEFSLPTNGPLRAIYSLYSFRVMPSVGGWITGAREPFTYLVESIRSFASPSRVQEMLREVGFSRVTIQRFLNGIAIAYRAVKP